MSASQELIRGCQTGGQGAFSGVVEAHKDAVYTLCLRALSDAERAEDLAEKVFLAAHQAIIRLDPETNLLHWLLSLAIERVTEPRAASTSGDEIAVVNTVLSELEPPFRMAVILRDVLLLDESAVAEILDIPLGTARSRIHRGRLTMARSLVEKVGE